MLNVPLNFNGGAPAAGNAPTNPVLNPAVNPVMNPGLGGQNNRDEPHGPGGG